MKKLLLIAAATLVCVSVMAQGKLAFQVNTTQLIYMTTDTGQMNPADAGKTVGGFALAGSSLYTGAGGTIASLDGAPTLIAGLWGGADAGSLTLQTTTSLANINLAGQLNQVSVTLALPAGTPASFRIDVYDSRNTSAADAWAMLNRYAGSSGVFTAVPQASVYSPIYQATAPVNSTLPVGTFVPLDYAAYPGYAGLIEVYATIPEPGIFALAGLGLASLLIFRRRK